jgi:glycosyltransferase involved in cell wall biosynthesis
MRIGLLIYGSLETVSGGYLYDRKLVEHLQSSGDQVQMISLPHRNYARHLTDNFSPSLQQTLQKFEGDFLLQDELNHPSLFWLNRRLKRKIQFPIISIVHHLRSQEWHTRWKNSIYLPVELAYLKTVDGFIFNSHTTLKSVEALGIDLAKTPHIVARPGGDQFEPCQDKDQILERAHQIGPLRVVFLGNLIPRKGLHTLIEALSRLSKGLIRLTVVGEDQIDPAYTQRILRMIRTSGLEAHVSLRGKLPADELTDLLKFQHVLAVPSQYEGYGIVYLEAMSFGLPAIGTTSGAAHEIISDGSSGFLVPPDDSHNLAARLELLANDRSLLAGMGIEARRQFELHPAWTQTNQAIREFLISWQQST